MSKKDLRYFFSSGVRFECRRCGFCCTGYSGSVYIQDYEIKKIAEFLNITTKDFISEYLYPFRDSYSIKEKENNHCIFYENGCKIYPVRPQQCRDYPFWVTNMRNEKNWQKTKKDCPGIGEGKLYTEDEILEILKKSKI